MEHDREATTGCATLARPGVADRARGRRRRGATPAAQRLRVHAARVLVQALAASMR
ncbi:hypothetical protein [Sorangium sp. So ce1099]|uniref:hypothetical protein n=1 Tax=Sorangium sp. So ce1099 TaxID=3133331 RepID=UPI003F5EBBD2